MTMQADLLVVGGGIAGMVAAVRASERGARVIVFERGVEERYRNASRTTGGVFHCCSRDVTTDPVELERVILARGGDAVRPELAHVIAQDIGRTIAWLREKGAKFMRGSPDPWHSHVLAPPNLSRRGLDWTGRGGDQLLRRLETLLIASGGSLLRGHEVTELVLAGNEVTGLIGHNQDGELFQAHGPVLIADGGFASDPELLGVHISPQPEKVLQRNVGSGRGAGLRMAMAAGAATTGLECFYGHVQAKRAMEDNRLWPYPWWDDVAVQGILVTPDGRRFCNEGLGGPYMANAIARLPDPASVWLIFDQAIWETGGKARHFPANPNLPQGGAELICEPTTPELAASAGLSTEGLLTEIAGYNASCQSGSFLPPRKTRPFTPLPITQAPFYAAPVCAGITYTMGGIAIDADARALRPDGTPLPGLYAAGATTGGLEGGENVSYVGGLVKSSITGLRAAEAVTGIR